VKKYLLLFLIVTSLVFGCSKEKHFVRAVPPSPPKTIVLPETEKGRTPSPYVVNGERYYPLPEKKFHGRPTSSGEIYNMYKKTAAHKTLPLGTYVEVLNLSNKKTTVVLVNDRGPFVKGRIIDLSRAAAKDIDLIGPGVVDVKIVALGKEVKRPKLAGGSKPLVEASDLKKGQFTIQVGAFEDKENALKLADRLRVIFDYVNVATYMDENRRTLYRVHVSKSETLTQAGHIEKRLEDMGFDKAFIVRI
jgi:rare lipoprotein A